MKFKHGSFTGYIDRHGFVRIGGCGFHYDSSGEGVRLSVKRAIAAEPQHPDAAGIRQAIRTCEKS